jgi:hypothetical protein
VGPPPRPLARGALRAVNQGSMLSMSDAGTCCINAQVLLHPLSGAASMWNDQTTTGAVHCGGWYRTSNVDPTSNASLPMRYTTLPTCV